MSNKKNVWLEAGFVQNLFSQKVKVTIKNLLPGIDINDYEAV